MTPGAGTAQLTSRVGCRRVRTWRRLVCGFVADVCGFSSADSRYFVGHSGVTRGGAIYDARCRNGTIDRSRWVSADAGGLCDEVGRVCGLGAAVFRATQVSPLRCICCIAADAGGLCDEVGRACVDWGATVFRAT